MVASHSGSTEEGLFVCDDDGVMKAIDQVMMKQMKDLTAFITLYKK